MQRKEKKALKPSSPFTPFRIEIDRKGRQISVLASGISSISEFSETRAILCSGEICVEISGKGLCIAVYEGGSAEVVGGVVNVGFVFQN